MALRCGVGALLFAPYLWRHFHDIPRKLVAVGFGLAALQGWGTHLTTILGLQFAPASHASALGPGFISVWVALWGFLFYRIKPTVSQGAGLLLIGLGALVLLANAQGSAWNQGMLAGDALFLCASAFGAVYLVYIQRNQIDPLHGAALIAVYSGLVYLPWYFATSDPSRFMATPLPELAVQVFYQGFAVGGLFILLIGYAVVRMGSQRFSMIVAFVPVLSLLFGRVIAGDAIRTWEVVAVGLITSGILYGARSRAQR